MVLSGNLFSKITGEVFDKHHRCLLLVRFSGCDDLLSGSRNSFIGLSVEWRNRDIDHPDVKLDELGRKFVRRLFRNGSEPASGRSWNGECKLFAFRSQLRYHVLLEDCSQE